MLLGATVVIAASGLADSILRVNRVQFAEGLRYDFQVTWNTLSAEPGQMALVEAIPGVTEVQAALIGPVTAAAGQRTLATFAISATPGSDFLRYEHLDGSGFMTGSDAVWVGHNLSRVLGVGVGDTLQMTALGQMHEARIAGIINQGVGSLVYIPTPLMRSWIPGGLPLVNAAFVRAEPASHDAVRAALVALPNVLAVETIAFTTRDMFDYMSLWVNFSYVFAAFGMVLTLVVVFNTISVNLIERHEELMIMRTTGARLREIGAAVAWETLSLAALGIALSVPLGLWVLALLLANYELDFFGMLNVVEARSFAVVFAGIVLVILLAQNLSMRGLRRSDLGATSKTLSM